MMRAFVWGRALVMLTLVALLFCAPLGAWATVSGCSIPDARPPPGERKFTSQAVEDAIAEMTPRFKDPNLAQLFANCLPNTLDTTVWHHAVVDGRNFTEVITGDITAMWLRDSANQVMPYVEFISKDPSLAALITGVVERQADAILLDAFANAFTVSGGPPSPHLDDSTSSAAFAGTRVDGMVPGIFERKFEVDSLCNFLELSRRVVEASGSAAVVGGEQWLRAVARVVEVLEGRQDGWEDLPSNPPYLFQRAATQPSDTLQDGIGWPARRTGLLRTSFRASDDAATMPFNIPENAFAAVTLEGISPILATLGENSLSQRASALAAAIRKAIDTHGTMQVTIDLPSPTHHSLHGPSHPPHSSSSTSSSTPTSSLKVYAYEVDGFGNAVFMDDANLPSLLSLPLLGFCNSSDALCSSTRSAVLSSRNPWFFNGTVGAAVGSPHTGWNRIWPLSLVTKALTLSSDAQIQDTLQQVVQASACSGLMHESVAINDPTDFSRPWFAWANSFFGQAILTISKTHPNAIFK